MTTAYKINPEALPRFTNTLEIGGKRWRIVWRWNNRTLGWYIDVYDVDDVLVLAGERLSVGGMIGFGSLTFNYLLTPGGDDDHVSWEDWPVHGKFTLILIES